MQRNVDYAKSATVLSALVMVLILIFGAAGLVSFNSGFKALSEKFDSFDVDEAAIASAVLEGIPEMPEYDTEKIDDVWKVMFGECRNTLETNAKGNVTEAFDDDDDDDDAIEYLEDNLEDFEEL